MNDKNETLQQLHDVLLDMLVEFDRICKKYDIHYFLDSGSALGAIRHGGFIPWDDDLDIGLVRSEYNRFLKVAAKELDSKYVLQTRETDPYYHKFHAKIRKLNTYYPEKTSNPKAYNGIFIDIFPFDQVPDNKYAYKVNKAFRQYCRSRMRIARFKEFRVNPYKKFLGWVFDHTTDTLFAKLYVWASSLYNKGNNRYLTCYEYTMCQHKLKLFKPEWMYPSVPVKFENHEFLIMNGYHEYLQEMYNDYMQLPPVGKREFHCSEEILFNTAD